MTHAATPLTLASRVGFELGIASLLGVVALLGAGEALAVPLVLHAAADGAGSACSEASPCGLAQAQAEVRSRKASVGDDVIVSLAPGYYFLDAPLTLTAEDSGVGSSRVIWEGAECGAVLSAGLPITGWTLHDAGANIWRAAVPDGFDTRQLWVNDQRAVRARTPGDQTTTGTEVSDLSSSDFWGMTQDYSNTSFPVSTYGNPDRIEAVMRFNWWRVERCPLASVNGDFMTFRQPCGQWAYTSEQRQVYYIENAYELLDSEGEWYLDPTVAAIYYKPRAGEDLATAGSVAGRLERVLHVDGASQITVQGLTLAHATWMFPSGDNGYTGWQGGYIYTPDGGYYQATYANVEIEGATDVVLERNRITHLGGAGVAVHGGSHGTRIVGNVIEDVSGHGVEVGHKDDDEGNAVVDTTIDNNLIRFVALEFQDNHAVHIPRAKDVYVLHNEINDTPYSAVAIGWGWSPDNGWWGGIHINDNEIWRAMLRGSDGGSIYAMSSQLGAEAQGSELMRNYLHDYQDPGRKHIGTGYMHGGHLYIEDGAGHYRVENNVATTTTRWLFTWASNNHDNSIQHNWSDTDASQNSIDGINNNVIANNTVVGDGNWPVEAQAVMDGAGVEPEYEDIKAGACAQPTGAGGTGGTDQTGGSGGMAGSGGAAGSGGTGGVGNGGVGTGGVGNGGVGTGGVVPGTGGEAWASGGVGALGTGGIPVSSSGGVGLVATGGSDVGAVPATAQATAADDPATGCACRTARRRGAGQYGWLVALGLCGVLWRRRR